VRAALTEAITSPPGKRQLRRGRLDAAAGTGADCLIDVPAEVTEVTAGEPVDVWDLDR
jgi:molybdopterin molybdotransferase